MKFFLLQSISGAHWVYCIFFCWGPLAAQGTLYVLTSRVFGQPRWLLRALGALTPNLGVAYPQPWSYLPPTLEVKTPRGGNFLSGCRKFRGVGAESDQDNATCPHHTIPAKAIVSSSTPKLYLTVADYGDLAVPEHQKDLVPQNFQPHAAP